DENVGVFQLPGASATDKPMLGGGDSAGAFTNDEDVKKALEFITSPTFKFSNPEAFPYIPPHKDFDTSNYAEQMTRNVAELGYASTVFRFDDSDLMPGAVGAGSFWKGMTAWIRGQQNLDDTLKDIDDRGPSSEAHGWARGRGRPPATQGVVRRRKEEVDYQADPRLAGDDRWRGRGPAPLLGPEQAGSGASP